MRQVVRVESVHLIRVSCLPLDKSNFFPAHPTFFHYRMPSQTVCALQAPSSQGVVPNISTANVTLYNQEHLPAHQLVGSDPPALALTCPSLSSSLWQRQKDKRIHCKNLSWQARYWFRLSFIFNILLSNIKLQFVNDKKKKNSDIHTFIESIKLDLNSSVC